MPSHNFCHPVQSPKVQNGCLTKRHKSRSLFFSHLIWMIYLNVIVKPVLKRFLHSEDIGCFFSPLWWFFSSYPLISSKFLSQCSQVVTESSSGSVSKGLADIRSPSFPDTFWKSVSMYSSFAYSVFILSGSILTWLEVVGSSYFSFISLFRFQNFWLKESTTSSTFSRLNLINFVL